VNGIVVAIIISITGFLSPGTSPLEPLVHPTAPASSFRLQHFIMCNVSITAVLCRDYYYYYFLSSGYWGLFPWGSKAAGA
jgi:hypothetical protein